jgi:hypothetical protein
MGSVENLAPLIQSLDYLDAVLAIVGALTFGLLMGRGKSIWGILSGAAIGGVAKPAFMFLVLGGAMLAIHDDQAAGPLAKSKAEQDKIIDFWTKPHHKRH